MTALPILTARDSKPPRRSAWIGGNMPVARVGLILNLLVPLFLLILDARAHQLGADPVNFAIHTTGIVAVIYLLLSLSITPVRAVSGWNWLVQFRRSLGVYAFYYACVHLLIYFWWDRNRNLSSTFFEITHRYYLMIGFMSLFLMFPLWATSFNAAIRALGAGAWKRLHRWSYVAAGLGCWHFYLQSKADKRRPDIFFAVLGVLLLWRVLAFLSRPPSKAISATSDRTAASGKLQFWKGELKVTGITKETPTVRTFRLSPPDGGAIPFAFMAGQFLNLSIEIDGKRFSRSYTIASPPTRDAYVELTIKREESGQVSGFLHDKLMTGDAVIASGPAGRFTFDSADEASRDRGVLLIAGGVGITPVMSILRDLTDRRWPGKIDLVFSVRSLAEVIFSDELGDLAARHPAVQVHITITRDVPADWSGLRGRITAEILRVLVPDALSRMAFVCGPDAMARDVRQQLLDMGVPSERIAIESFTPGAAAIEISTSSTGKMTATVSPTITFAKSNRSAPPMGGKTVLEVAEAIGVRIDFDCRAGICGTCRCKLLTGHVTMDVTEALTRADEADGFILACQAHAEDDITVDA